MTPSARRAAKHYLFWILLVGILSLGNPSSSLGLLEEEDPKTDRVEAVADQLEYRKADKKMVGKGNVVVTYGDVKLTSDYAEVDTENKIAYARGHVLLLRGDRITARGEEATYHFEKDQGEFPNGESVEWPWYTQGKLVKQVARGKFEIEDAAITTCDLDRPHYQIRAQKATVLTDDKIIARNLFLHVLGKKVFWIPYAVIPLQEKLESPIQIQPGYSSQDGAYVLTSKAFSIFKWLWGKWHLDWRSKRGVGGGLDFDYHFERFRTDGHIKTYWTQDEEAPTPGLENPFAVREDRDRGRIVWRHRTDFSPHSHLIFRYHRLDDEFFLQDFFEREFRSDVEPTSFINFVWNSDRHGFYAFNQKRMNHFGDVTERLPEIRFDWKGAPFLIDRLYYENSFSLSNLNQKTSRSDSRQHTFRFDTFHELTRPLKWKEIKLTPSAFFRETLYSRDQDESDAAARTAFGFSMDLRTHFYRPFNVSGDFLGIEVNQLRHLFEPSLHYEGTVHSSVSDEELHAFDSIDQIDDANEITFGLENRIQTKRLVNGKMQRVDLVSLNTFLTYDFHPDREFSRGGFSTWTGELQFRPYEWLQYEIRFEYDMVRDKFRDFNQDLLARKGRFHVLIGHRLVTKRAFINADGNNQFVLDAGYWINDLWKVGGHIRWDAEDQELEEWQISATRDLHDFLLDFGYNVRNSDIDNSNKELFFLFHLKAFPEFPLKSGNRASFAEPRISATVAGSNTPTGVIEV